MGIVTIEPGFFIYVGSAFGPGGLKARVGRHFRTEKRLRWHIDYVRAVTEPCHAWCSNDSDRLEHHWAGAIARLAGVSTIQGIGSSDCSCEGHLFACQVLPSSSTMRRALGSPLYMMRPELARGLKNATLLRT